MNCLDPEEEEIAEYTAINNALEELDCNSCTVFIPLSNLINASIIIINNTSIHSKQNYKIRKRVTFASN